MGTPAEAWVANPAIYGFFTQAEVNASSASRYSGVGDDAELLGGGESSSYQLFTPLELNQSGSFLCQWICRWEYQWVNYLVNHPGLFGLYRGSGRLRGTGEKGICGIAGHGAGGFGTTKSFLCSLPRKDEYQGPPHP